MPFSRDPRPDPSTADRLLAGRIGPDDAPPGYRRVAELLGEAGSGFSAPAGADEGALITAMVAAVQTGPGPAIAGRKSMLRRVLAAKTVAIVGVLALTASGAAAGTGNLPDGLQDKVAKAAKHVGVNLPVGKARVTEGCPAGQTFKNRGQYLKWVRANDPEGFEAAKLSRCGMPLTSKGTPGVDEPGDAPEAPEGDKPKKEKGTQPESAPGKSGEDHGQAGQDHGKAGQDDGQADQGQGQAGEDHGKAGEDHGKAGEDHGQSGEVPGTEDLPVPVPLPNS